jgi:hypothetical protein
MEERVVESGGGAVERDERLLGKSVGGHLAGRWVEMRWRGGDLGGIPGCNGVRTAEGESRHRVDRVDSGGRVAIYNDIEGAEALPRTTYIKSRRSVW